ncbi:zf-HC2 domain-containing protein, partial [Streptomyces sp. NPDC023723]|uniref:zf-HC2 domain-containing protein n=1 Tax=Streptomyces sp. NPDC023723 TaxID=3154323 RepID=UPI0033E207CA
MRSLERHRDAGAYALGVLDERDAFRFEDHLMGCPRCTATVTGFRPVTRQLLLYRRATPAAVAGGGLSRVDTGSFTVTATAELPTDTLWFVTP